MRPVLDVGCAQELQRREMHACKTSHGSDARMVSDRGALRVELKGGKTAEDDEAMGWE